MKLKLRSDKVSSPQSSLWPRSSRLSCQRTDDVYHGHYRNLELSPESFDELYVWVEAMTRKLSDVEEPKVRLESTREPECPLSALRETKLCERVKTHAQAHSDRLKADLTSA